MTLVYRNPGAWGSGKGARLTSLEGDGNIYTLDQRIVTLESDGSGKTIDYIAQDTSTQQLYIHYTDHSIDGPFDLPSIELNPTGPFQSDHNYLKNDIFFIDGSLYLVLRDHTSPSHFDVYANDGSGHDFYALLLMNPGNIIPNGGTTGQVLAKVSDHDLDVEWIDVPTELPVAGDTGQILAKASAHDGDVEWVDDINYVPAGGSTNYVLTKNSSSDYDVSWQATKNAQPFGSTNMGSVSGTTAIDYTLGNLFKMTPTGATDIQPNTGGQNGTNLYILIITSGTSSYNITFSSSSSMGTLATGTVSGKKFLLHFIYDASYGWVEISRTTAM